VKAIRIHKSVAKELERLDAFTKLELAELFSTLAHGDNLGMPTSRPMLVIAHGAHELRVKAKAGIYRVFYYVKVEDAILVFHFYKKTTQGMPRNEITTAKARLKEML
jgi:phage-related protein